MRLPLAQVPLWQILLSLGLLTASAVLVVLAVGRIFRLGMLHYGKPIRPGELVRLLRAS
jgi:ABC-2 type transport system permease protein